LFASVRMIEETYFSNMACSSFYGGSIVSQVVCVWRGARGPPSSRHRSQLRDLRPAFYFFGSAAIGRAICIESVWFESNTLNFHLLPLFRFCTRAARREGAGALRPRAQRQSLRAAASAEQLVAPPVCQ
jgi:hypothetical protein